MDVVLLERIESLGQMGEVVSVKNGYARNYLLPQGKAQRATAANLASFEERRVELEARNLERRGEAQGVSTAMQDATFVVIRQAGESGQLYGSVQARDVVEGLDGVGYKVARNQIVLNQPIKTLGLHPVQVNLHPEVHVEVIANVARSEAEAERQAAGEDVLADDDDDDIFEMEAVEEETEAEDGEAEEEAAEITEDDGEGGSDEED
ncbi:MAG: 50S ribosomal protein L9 [Rhodospirillaceae bacterium]|jgi:large subunit ribosomal protein L9|nr:50S ribosomal protein L9 [Rhodospirillaceae bacterium]MBT4490919.1 50S ribosomal protein L9 [Rhodospirillaceae bacterium]MBT5193724.1 50S ribosomal protein L9 [Rhodospirillaceae bacterium]MBT5896537.1 50S ribosomal protein L9 [Rhodospirillaceae bacterium]MBT6426382.1 50S ribosomal protein L9 [Rhodospirillaceae bacterium]